MESRVGFIGHHKLEKVYSLEWSNPFLTVKNKKKERSFQKPQKGIINEEETSQLTSTYE